MDGATMGRERDLPPGELAGTYAGRRVLVTGHTGFKGGWLSAWLLDMGARPAGYALAPPGEPGFFAATGLAHRMDHVVGELADIEHLTRRVATLRPELIVHMAAQSLVRPSYISPRETFATNVLGTVNLLQIAREAGVERFLQVSTDEVYGSLGPEGSFTETTPITP
ncbi:MAG: GDP-mannose 4,6-dehydratase, partial [Acidobacteriota bacterium]